MSCLNSKGPEEENAELMRKVAGGDTGAFVRLYLSFVPEMRRFFAKHGADRELCDDLVQQIFVELWAKCADFPNDSSFEKYLFHFANNTLNKELRRARRRAEFDLKALPHKNDDSNHALSEPENWLYAKELIAAIERAKAKLTDKERQALEASQEMDASFRELSKQIGCSYTAFMGRLQRARKRMREQLECFLDDEKDFDKTYLPSAVSQKICDFDP